MRILRVEPHSAHMKSISEKRSSSTALDLSLGQDQRQSNLIQIIHIKLL